MTTQTITDRDLCIVRLPERAPLPAGHSLGAHVSLRDGASGYYLLGPIADAAVRDRGLDLVIVERPDYEPMDSMEVLVTIAETAGMMGWPPSDARLRSLRAEAVEHGDEEQVALCDRALDGDREAEAACCEALDAAAAMID